MQGPIDDGWYDPEATTFGDRLAGAREQAGMTQEALAKRLGVKLKTLQAWENDLSEPRANKLSMMSGMLNVSLLWILSGEGQSPEATGTAAELPAELNEMLDEIKDVRAQLALSAERLDCLEKGLRARFKADAVA